MKTLDVDDHTSKQVETDKYKAQNSFIAQVKKRHVTNTRDLSKRKEMISTLEKVANKLKDMSDNLKAYTKVHE